jgi:hypothetical protein
VNLIGYAVSEFRAVMPGLKSAGYSSSVR